MNQPSAPCSRRARTWRRGAERGIGADLRAAAGAQEPRREDDPDQPRPQSMDELPPEDALELLQRHAAVELLELGNLLVEGELPLPLGRRQRRHNAADRPPLGDREVPDSVSRVMPPMTTMTKIMAQQASSQRPTARSAARLAREDCDGVSIAVTIRRAVVLESEPSPVSPPRKRGSRASDGCASPDSRFRGNDIEGISSQRVLPAPVPVSKGRGVSARAGYCSVRLQSA